MVRPFSFRLMDHATLVATLRDPAFYDPPVEEVEVVQTHISSVFLAGERAYKLKKPVNFGFLDFSTPELRRHYCRAEVELNRRLAPDVYLGVEPIVSAGGRLGIGGEGEPIDWLVVMRRMDAKLHGIRLLESGELSRHHVDRLVELLVPFYRDARTGEEVDRYGTLDAVRFNTDENFAQTAEYVGKLVSRQRYEYLRRWTGSFYREHGELFARRVAAGRIRDSHGDLHLGNIFFEDPPIVFDCIEFNERFRCGDVAADLAFLAMDLDFRDRSDLARHLIARYVEASGDKGLVDMLDFYKCYRAYVRGKVCAFTSTDRGLDDTERRAQRNRARHYFGLAYRYAGGSERPPLVVLHGLMGTGKTQIARYLREAHGWHVVSTDAVRKQLAGLGEDTRVYVPYNAGLYSPEMSARTYDEVCGRAENLLHAGFPVAIDGAFKRERDRQKVIDLAGRAGARLLFLETTCSPAEQRRRLLERRLHDTRSDGRVELMERQRAEYESPAAHPDLHAPDLHAPDLYASVPTDGSEEETRQSVIDLLEQRGLLSAVATPT